MKLTRKEKEVIGILSMGSFLEYFDLYLYIHFATVLNQVFFNTDESTSSYLLTSFAYCTSFIFRPIGAVIFGYIGDTYGRVRVINITLFLMGFSCLGIFFLPEYSLIGPWASVMITLFRAFQGMSTMGEIIGGEIYLTEYLKGKNIFIGVATLTLMSLFACQLALYLINLALNEVFPWRFLFLFGLSIFLLGYVARRCLIESPEFLKIKNKPSCSAYVDTKVPFKTYLASFNIHCVSSVVFFISIVGINNLLRTQYGYTESQIVERNLYSTYFHIGWFIFALLLFRYISPYIIAQWRNWMGMGLLALSPFLLGNLDNIIFFQSLLMIFCAADASLINPIIYKSIPVQKRFRVEGINFAFAKAFVAIFSSFGLNLLSPIFGDYIFLIFLMPFLIGYYFSLHYFKNLDEKNPNGLLKVYKNGF